MENSPHVFLQIPHTLARLLLCAPPPRKNIIINTLHCVLSVVIKTIELELLFIHIRALFYILCADGTQCFDSSGLPCAVRIAHADTNHLHWFQGQFVMCTVTSNWMPHEHVAHAMIVQSMMTHTDNFLRFPFIHFCLLLRVKMCVVRIPKPTKNEILTCPHQC